MLRAFGEAVFDSAVHHLAILFWEMGVDSKLLIALIGTISKLLSLLIKNESMLFINNNQYPS
jgi:hypothetical protein